MYYDDDDYEGGRFAARSYVSENPTLEKLRATFSLYPPDSAIPFMRGAHEVLKAALDAREPEIIEYITL